MPFQNILDVTVEHLKPSDFKLLEEYTTSNNTFVRGAPVVVYGFEYGWTVSTSGGTESAIPNAEELAATREDKIENMKVAGFSDEFIALCQHAWQNNAVMIRFDRDAEPEPGFPLFDQSTGEMYDDGLSESQPSALPAPGTFLP